MGLSSDLCCVHIASQPAPWVSGALPSSSGVWGGGRATLQRGRVSSHFPPRASLLAQFTSCWSRTHVHWEGMAFPSSERTWGFEERCADRRGLSRLLSGEESVGRCRRLRRHGFDPWVGEILWSRRWPSTPVFLSGKFQGQRSLAGCRPWG